jgi:hypothetical protein
MTVLLAVTNAKVMNPVIQAVPTKVNPAKVVVEEGVKESKVVSKVGQVKKLLVLMTQ